MIGEDGYICLTDFGLAKLLEDHVQAETFCGTPDYLAPEILHRTGHGFPVDWWTLGILVYDMICGFPPFFTGGNNPQKMYKMIKTKPIYFPDAQRHKIYMSDNCKDFILKLLDKEAESRLGTAGDIEEVLSHPWLSEIDPQQILEKTIEAPMKPSLSNDQLDTNNFDKQFTSEEVKVTEIPEEEM